VEDPFLMIVVEHYPRFSQFLWVRFEWTQNHPT